MTRQKTGTDEDRESLQRANFRSGAITAKDLVRFNDSDCKAQKMEARAKMVPRNRRSGRFSGRFLPPYHTPFPSLDWLGFRCKAQ